MNVISYFLEKKILVLAWVFLIGLLISLALWVHKEMENEQEFQGAFAFIPEPILNSVIKEENTKMIERLDTPLTSPQKSPIDEKIALPDLTEQSSLPQESKFLADENKKLLLLLPVPTLTPAPVLPVPVPPAAIDPKVLKEPFKETVKVPVPEIEHYPKTTVPPFIEHGRMFNQDNPLPKIIIVITGLGQSLDSTMKAIQNLPPEVTLCFVPYARNLTTLMNQSRNFGHENLLMLPMEPESYPNRDPGPYTLLTGVEPLKNVQKLEIVLSKGSKFVGLTDFMGSRFITSENDLQPIFKVLKEKGFIFLESTPSLTTNAKKIAEQLELPYMKVTRSLDPATSLVSIDDQLKEMEKVALSQGHVILYAFTYPKVIDSLNKWIKNLKQKGFILAPLTAIYQKDFNRSHKNG